MELELGPSVGYLQSTAIVLALAAVSASTAQDGDRGAAIQHDMRLVYERAGNRLVWLDARGYPTRETWTVLSRIRAASDDGLAPADYEGSELEYEASVLAAERQRAPQEARAFDERLTRNVLRYFRDLHLGRANPRALGFQLDHALEIHDFSGEVHMVLAGRSFDDVVAQLRPPFVQYARLRQLLRSYRETDAARARQIELAMERLRWLPDLESGQLIVVNIPMYRVWGWDPDRGDGMAAIEMAAIIGRAPRTRTPIFASQITTVVLNPEWNVPDSIVRGEILPALKRDPAYLTRNHMEMTGDEHRPRVRQRPGPWNALGQVKFVLPNTHGVALHGTPDPKLFERPRRDFSHGCVRVEDPIRLAEWILGPGSEWTKERLLATIDEGRTRTIPVADGPRIVLFYATAAFVPTEGVIRFADDIYGHDARLEAWLKARSADQ